MTPTTEVSDVVAWAMSEIAQRLQREAENGTWRPENQMERCLNAASGRAVAVEASVIHQHPDQALLRIDASTGLIRRVRAERHLTLFAAGPATPCAKRYVLIFERGANVTSFVGLEDASNSIESVDVEDGNYVAGFFDDGEELEIQPVDVYADVRPSGRYDPERLSALIRASNGPQELVNNPHLLAAALI